MNLINTKKATPVMQQYLSLKSEYKDYMLLYRLGDFYELFFEDAILASKSLNIVLTKRGQYNNQDIPMCGVPFNTSEYYFHKLISLGYKIAICEQLETPAEAKKRGIKSIVKRDVVRIITPGTIVEDSLLIDKEHNYLSCITKNKDDYGFSWLELSTGTFFYYTTNLNNLHTDLLRISPKEIIISDKLLDSEVVISILKKHEISLTNYSVSFFEHNKTYNTLCDFYKVNTLDGVGNFNKAEVSSCGALIEYIKITQKGSLPRLKYPQKYIKQNFMFIDSSALKNLELFYTQSGEKKGSLMYAIDYTKTSSGSRMLKHYLSSPFACANVINKKLDAVEFFIKNHELRKELRKELSEITDIERILSRIILTRSSPKDIYNLKLGLEKILKLSQLLYGLSSHGINILYVNLGEHGDILSILNETIVENNVTNIKEGGFINSKHNKQLSELLYIQNNSNNLINNLRDNYRKITKISNLKIQYNNLIGYYIEVSTNHTITLKDFIHRQSLSNSTRYTTPELKELESKIIKAKESAINLEIEIFTQLCKSISEISEEIFLAAHTISELDLITALAELAVQNNYVRPVIDSSSSFNIIKGRHPVVETKDKFIPNDINISQEQRLCLITGPNMAGKSTFLRQNALIAILSHIGSFVPAEYAHIGIIDKIFSRVGASDNITAGHSTFMVEMIETSSIINQATPKSLVILDEVGRGTGLYDGLSLACAVVEHIHNINKCRAIFATHYHELAQLSNSLKHLKCFCMKVDEWQDKIVFLHEVIPGSTDKSYGINVAKLAGFPPLILERAEKLMKKFKKDNQLLLLVD